jgi:Tfp pilus assembly protein PilF
MRRAAGVLAVMLLACGAAALAQTYPATPQPHSTAPADLHAAAVQRAIQERFRLGLAALDARNDASAAAEFEAALALHPREPQGSTAHYDLALAYAGLGRLDDAAHELHAALALDAGFLAAMANLVAIDVQRNDLRDARAVADRFVALAPDSARALYSRGIVALKSGDAPTARDDFGKLLRNNPAYAVAHYDLGLAEIKLRDSASAMREFETALQLAPTYARASFALGTVLLEEGRPSDARAAFDRAARDAVGDVTLENLAVSMRDAIPAPP